MSFAYCGFLFECRLIRQLMTDSARQNQEVFEVPKLLVRIISILKMNYLS